MTPASKKFEPKKPIPIDPKDLFKLVLDTRNFEITNFWQRSNYFLVLNSALAISFMNAKAYPVQLSISVLGIIVALLWYRVTIGSKFWQVRWEKKLQQVEKHYVEQGLIPSEFKLFSEPVSVVVSEVTEALKLENKNSWFANLLDVQILGKPSVTFAMITMAAVFALSWTGLLCVLIYRCTAL